MAGIETVGPFDGSPWAQDQWYRQAPLWAPSGVIDVAQSSSSAGALGLSFSGLTPTLAAGRAWVRGGGYELSGGSKTLPAVAANTNASLSRRDRIVLRRDLAAKTITLTPLQGTPAASPAAPALTQVETGQWDSPLFSFLVPPNSGTTISGIIDERTWVDPSTGQLAVVSGALALTPNYQSAAATWGAPKWVKTGTRVGLQGSLTNSVTGTPFNATAGQEYQVATLPTNPDGSSLAPADTRAYSVAYGNGSSFGVGLVVVHTDGRVNFLSSTTVSLSSAGQLSLALSGIDWIPGV